MAPTSAPASPASAAPISLARANANAKPCAMYQQVKPKCHGKPGQNNRQPIGRVLDTTGQHDRPRQNGRHIQIEREGAEDIARAFRKHKDQCESRKNLVQMVARIKAAYDENLDQCARRRSRGQRRHQPQPERAGRRSNPRTGKSPNHVKRAMRKVDQPHHAENQRQAGGHQEQHHAELQTVQQLFNEKCGCHSDTWL